MLLNFKEVETPGCLTAANITRIQVKLDLILGSAKLHSGAIVALIHILEYVFDSLDRGNGLHIDMTPVLPDEILAVTDDPSIVNLISVAWTSANDLASVKTPCPCIRVISDGGMLPKILGKAFGTGAILHAGRILSLMTTGTMNHELFDKLKQLRMVCRKLRGHKAINLLRGAQLGMRLKEDNDVCMRKAPLLKLNGVEVAINVTKNAIIDVLDKRAKLGMKDTCDEVRTLMGFVTAGTAVH